MKLDKDLILQFEERELLVPINDGDRVTASDIFIREAWSRITDHANKLLRDEMSRWPVVVAPEPKGYMWSTGKPETHDLYRSRIMPPQPIPKETAEDVLRDLIKDISNIDRKIEGQNWLIVNNSFIDRARKVLK